MCGAYDGYGRLHDDNGVIVAGERGYTEPDEHGHITMYTITEPVCAWTENNDGPTVWHHTCWLLAGSPGDYRGQSANAADQGHFFEEGTYDIPEPS